MAARPGSAANGAAVERWTIAASVSSAAWISVGRRTCGLPWITAWRESDGAASTAGPPTVACLWTGVSAHEWTPPLSG